MRQTVPDSAGSGNKTGSYPERKGGCRFFSVHTVKRNKADGGIGMAAE